MHQVSHSGRSSPLHLFCVHTNHHLTSGSVEIPLPTCTGNSSSIGEEPVPYSRLSTTSSYAEQGIIITFTNNLQHHDTVVVVCCTIEGEPDITFSWEGRDINVTMLRYWKLAPYLKLKANRGMSCFEGSFWVLCLVSIVLTVYVLYQSTFTFIQTNIIKHLWPKTLCMAFLQKEKCGS